MLDWGKRLREWGSIVRMHSGSVPWTKMALAILSGPVPRNVWRARMRKCAKCPVSGRVLLRDNNGTLKWVGLHICRKQITPERIIGCGCNTTMLALTADPYPSTKAHPSNGGCWAHAITGSEGWPAYYWYSRWAKVRAIWGFFSR